MSDNEASTDAEEREAETADHDGETQEPAEPVMEIVHPEDLVSEETAQAVAADPGTQLAEAQDRVLRAQAELENFRRRAQRELQDALKYSNAGLVRELLPVLDNLNRAIEATTPSDENAALLDGVKMVAQQFLDALARHGCTRVDALHAPFDPNIHEALSKIPNDEHPEMTVIHEMLPGFVLHGRVVRPSQVVVSAGPANRGEESAEQEE